MNFGRVVIVTNAKKGWVELSSYYLLPRVHEVIETYIPVISAQEQFGTEHTHDPHLWKRKSFQTLWEIENLLDASSLLNLIVVGDSDFEMDAGKFF